MPVIPTVVSVYKGLNCQTKSNNCLDCKADNILVLNNTQNYCADILKIDKSYFVVSLSTLYIKFHDKLNPAINLDIFEGHLFSSQADYEAYLAGTLPLSNQITFSFNKGGYRVYQSHLIFKLDIETSEIVNGLMLINLKNSQYLNSSGEVKFYDKKSIVVNTINYYRTSSQFENVIGIIVGVLLGLNGFLAIFIPAIKFTIMSMKVFQMNNYFFLINVNLPMNLYLFFENIQIGNIFKQLEAINPLSFMANDTCKEFQEKLLSLNKTCQLFNNAGPHMLWFSISGIIKLVLEGVQKVRERQGIPRGKLYEFLKLKFGRRYFIELLNYFHMDLVMYNLMNLLFSEMDNFTTFFNLFVSVILMVFFIYFYIMMFVIVSNHAQDFLLTSLCDPLNKLGSIEEKKKKEEKDAQLNKATTKRFIDGKSSNRNMDHLKLPDNLNQTTDRNPSSDRKQIEDKKSRWNMKRIFDEVKLKKFKIPRQPEDEEYERLKDQTVKGVIRVAGSAKKEEATFEPANIYRFLFVNSHCMNTYSIYYYPIGFIKEFFLAMILVMSYSSGVLQSLVFSCIFTLVYINNLTQSPLQNEFNNRLLKIYSFLYMTMSFITLLLNIFDESVSPKTLYYFFGYVLILLEIGIIAMVITMTVNEFLKVRRDKKLFEQNKNKVQHTLHTELKSVQPSRDNKNNEAGKENEEERKSHEELLKQKSKSEMSSDSFKKIEYVMPRKDQEGGMFFKTRGQDQYKDHDDELSNRMASKSSIGTKNSKPISSRGNSESVGDKPSLKVINGKPQPRRVDSDSNNMSDEDAKKSRNASVSKGSALSKAKKRRPKK